MAPGQEEMRTPRPEPIPEWMQRETHEINRLSYNVDKESAKKLKAMIQAVYTAENVKIIHTGKTTGILTSFHSWRQLASYLDWIPHNGLTRQLIPALRISCGSVRMGSPARTQAIRIMKQKAAELDLTEGEADQDSSVEDEEPGTYKHSVYYHCRGVYCQYCNHPHHSGSAATEC